MTIKVVTVVSDENLDGYIVYEWDDTPIPQAGDKLGASVSEEFRMDLKVQNVRQDGKYLWVFFEGNSARFVYWNKDVIKDWQSYHWGTKS